MTLQAHGLLWPLAACLLSLHAPLAAQTLRLSLGAGQPGGAAEVEISLRSPRGKQPSSLQWQASVPAGQLGFQDPIASIGPAAKAAGKSVRCALKGAPGEGLVVCVLSGGQDPIADGVVAVLRLKIAPGVRRGAYHLKLDHGLAVFKDLTHVVVPDTETLVNVGPR